MQGLKFTLDKTNESKKMVLQLLLSQSWTLCLCFHFSCALCDLVFPHVDCVIMFRYFSSIILIYVPHISCIQFSVSLSVSSELPWCVCVYAASPIWITFMWIIKDCLSLFSSSSCVSLTIVN